MQAASASYDADTRQRRTVKQMLFWLVILIGGSFAFAYAWRLYVGPYTLFYTRRYLNHEKALVALTTDACTDPAKRARLEGYNNCEQARFDAEQSPSMLAFYDLMDDLKFCDKGVCIVFGFNVTDSLWTMFRLALVVGVVLYAMSIVGFISVRHGQQVGAYQLPMMTPGAAEYMQMLAAQQRHVAEHLVHTAPSKPPPHSSLKCD